MGEAKTKALAATVAETRSMVDTHSVALKMFEDRLSKLEKITDTNSEVAQDVMSGMSSQIDILIDIIQDVLRNDVVMKGIGSIDFDAYILRHKNRIEAELKKREEEAENNNEEDEEEVFEFGGDCAKTDREEGQATA
jgi:hypothetical protein